MKNVDKKIQLLFNLLKKGKLNEAKELNKSLIREYPKNAFLYNTIGLIYFDEKNYNDALSSYKKGILINPKFAPLYNNLGNLHSFNKDYNEAEICFKKAIQLEKNNPESRNNLGNLYQDINKNQDAIDIYLSALNINPSFFPSHYNLAITYKNIGNFKKSKKHLNKTIELKPYFFSAHRTLSQIMTYKINDEHFTLLKKINNDTEIKKNPNSELCFALGKAYDDIKDFKSAFFFFEKGNKIQRENITFSIENIKNEFTSIKKTFTSDLLLNFKQNLNNDSTPIFIVGMPRSGTTLTEQILSNHQDVFGADELSLLPDLISKHLINGINISKKDIDLLNNISNEYIINLKKISKNSKRVTDKLPINFKYIGLIKILFPNSKIIHCVRNPKDNCFSIYKNYFTSQKMNFAFDFDEICKYYNLYSDLMKHWKLLVPNFVYDISYEDLVKNPKNVINLLLEECNLEWNDSCLKFYENKRSVKTVSDTQVRKKMYTSSVDSWKMYKKNIESKFKEYKI